MRGNKRHISSDMIKASTRNVEDIKKNWKKKFSYGEFDKENGKNLILSFFNQLVNEAVQAKLDELTTSHLLLYF